MSFEDAWTSIGPHDHALALLYRAAAEKILEQAITRSRRGIAFGETLTARLGDHAIGLPVDELERSAHGFVIRRLRTGRHPKKPDQRVLHALMAEAGRQSFGHEGRFEVHYLTSDVTVDIPLANVMDGRLEEVLAALNDLRAGHFPALPENQEDCPRCPHYFICPAIPD